MTAHLPCTRISCVSAGSSFPSSRLPFRSLRILSSLSKPKTPPERKYSSKIAWVRESIFSAETAVSPFRIHSIMARSTASDRVSSKFFYLFCHQKLPKKSLYCSYLKKYQFWGSNRLFLQIAF